MAAFQSAPTERHHWAACQWPKADAEPPRRFLQQEDASRWQAEIVYPATILGDEETVSGPLDADLIEQYRMAGITPPDTLQRTLRRSVPIRWSSRLDAQGREWVLFEREDGQISRGVGAYMTPLNLDHFYLPGYIQEERNNRKFGYLVPVTWFDEHIGEVYTGPRFRDYYPLDKVNSAPAADWETELTEALAGEDPEFSCELGDDWEFAQILKRAKSLEGHQFRARRIESLPHQLAMIAYDLDDSLPASASVRQRSALLGSWSVWQHVAAENQKLFRELECRFEAAEGEEKKRLGQLLRVDQRSALRDLHTQMSGYSKQLSLLNQEQHAQRIARPPGRRKRGPAPDETCHNRCAEDGDVDSRLSMVGTPAEAIKYWATQFAGRSPRAQQKKDVSDVVSKICDSIGSLVCHYFGRVDAELVVPMALEAVIPAAAILSPWDRNVLQIAKELAGQQLASLQAQRGSQALTAPVKLQPSTPSTEANVNPESAAPPPNGDATADVPLPSRNKPLAHSNAPQPRTHTAARTGPLPRPPAKLTVAVRKGAKMAPRWPRYQY